jgi:hypothetical protein
MPELKNIKVEYEEEETTNIQYANKTKERERIEKQNNYEKKKLEYVLSSFFILSFIMILLFFSYSFLGFLYIIFIVLIADCAGKLRRKMTSVPNGNKAKS